MDYEHADAVSLLGEVAMSLTLDCPHVVSLLPPEQQALLLGAERLLVAEWYRQMTSARETLREVFAADTAAPFAELTRKLADAFLSLASRWERYAAIVYGDDPLIKDLLAFRWDVRRQIKRVRTGLCGREALAHLLIDVRRRFGGSSSVGSRWCVV
jgi:hypothetical protein